MSFTKEEKEIFAKLTIHEFLLEVMLTNFLLNTDEQSSEAFKSELLSKMSSGYTRVTTEGTDDLDIAQLSKQQMEHFLNKVTEREASLR